MKKLYFVLLLLLLATTVKAQEYIQRPTAINTWTYVSDYDAEFPFNKNITLQYDEKGNLSYYHHVINYPASPYTNIMWFTYDALNRLSYKQFYYEEANMFGTYRYYYTYDVLSNLVECYVKQRTKASMYFYDDFVDHSKDVYQYEDGKKTRREHFESFDNSFTLELQYYYLYEYSDSGSWSLETKYNADEQPITKTEYTFSDSHEVLTKTVSNWSTEIGTWVTASLTEYEYSDGNLIEKRITNWTNGEISQQQRQLYVYNENGNCAQILFQTLEDNVYVDKNRALYLYDENGLCTNANAERWNDTTWVMGGFPSDVYLFFDDIDADVNDVMGSMEGCTRAEVTNYVTTPNPQYQMTSPDLEGEWFYEIQNENGSVTYQHLEYTADTVIDGKDHVKVIVRTNQIYDKDFQVEVTHEYVYEEEGVVYWWNKESQAFTTLYDLDAGTGDEWTVDVGHESLVIHVDSVKYFEYNGLNYRTLCVSDSQNLFTGDIVCCFGHLTSFFPEALMNRDKGFRVNGLRCYWVGDILLYHQGEEDCDAIYIEFHEVNETVDDSFQVYPNPTDGVIFVGTHSVRPWCERTHSMRPYDTEYRITNVLGQTLMSGTLTESSIDVSALPSGLYFLTVDGQTVKLMKH